MDDFPKRLVDSASHSLGNKPAAYFFSVCRAEHRQTRYFTTIICGNQRPVFLKYQADVCVKFQTGFSRNFIAHVDWHDLLGCDIFTACVSCSALSGCFLKKKKKKKLILRFSSETWIQTSEAGFCSPLIWSLEVNDIRPGSLGRVQVQS